MTEKRSIEVDLAATRQREIAVVEQRTTTLRLRGPRPIVVVETATAGAFLDGSWLPLGRGEPGAVTAIEGVAAALEHLAAHEHEQVLVTGHGPDEGLAARRARAVAALLAGDRERFAGEAQGAGAREVQAALQAYAAARGVACDPGKADGIVGPRTRAALAAFRRAAGLTTKGDDLGPGEWEAVFEAWLDLLAARLGVDRAALAARQAQVQLAPARAVGCAAAWPPDRVRIIGHSTLAAERVDVLCFAPEHAPELKCHPEDGPADPSKCDLYRKGKYRCVSCSPLEAPPGFRCLEVAGPHFDFDRSLVRPDGFPSLQAVAALLHEDAAREGALFGHTDTAGSDAYNKALSERRARAVFGALTRDVEGWEALWKAEGWDGKTVEAMLQVAGAEDVGAFQLAKGLPRSGWTDATTRRALIEAYLEAAVPSPVAAARFRDFGGGRFMGCGEFNPYEVGKPDERSRRVVALVYAPAAAPRGLPCKLGDLKPCEASCRKAGTPSPAGPGDKTPHFRCAVYRRIAAQCACKQEPPPPPGPTGLRIERWEGDPEGAAPGSFDAHDLTVPPGTAVRLRWKVHEAERQDMYFERPGAARFKDTSFPEAEGTHVVLPSCPDQTYVLLARKGKQAVEAAVRVRVSGAPARPKITSFAASPDEGDPNRHVLDWAIAGPYTQVLLEAPPLTLDVTAVTDNGGLGVHELDGLDSTVTPVYTLRVLDEAGVSDTATTPVPPGAKPPKPPKPDDPVDPPPPPPPPKPPKPPEPLKAKVVWFGIYRANGPDKVLRKELLDLKNGEQITMAVKVKGLHKEISVQPSIGVLEKAGTLYDKQLTFDPSQAAKAPGKDGVYTLMIDGQPVDTVKVGFVEKTKWKEWNPTVEFEVPLVKETRIGWVVFEMKAFVGVKCKVLVDEGETLGSVELKIGSNQEIRGDLVKEWKFTDKTAMDQHWLAVRPVATKGSAGASFKPTKGEAEVSAKLEVTWSDLTVKGKKVTPKSEFEAVAIKLKLGMGSKWELDEPGELKVKQGAEVIWTELWPKEKTGLPWDLREVTGFGGLNPSGKPDWLRIALMTIGFDALIAVGLVAVGVVCVIEVIRLAIFLGEMRAAASIMLYAKQVHAELWARVPEGLKDASVDTQDVPPDPAPSTPRGERGLLLGRKYRRINQREYRAQHDIQKARAELVQAARKADPAASQAQLDAQVDVRILEMFRQQWSEKYAATEARVNAESWYLVRKEVYLGFSRDAENEPSKDPVARERAWRELFMGNRSGMDFDFPDIDDELFELGMADQWEASGKAGYRSVLQTEWEDLGYEMFPPNRIDRRSKQSKKKGHPGRIYDVATGKEVDPAQCAPRSQVFQQLEDRHVRPRNTWAKTDDMVAGVGLTDIVKGYLMIPGNELPMDCISSSDPPANPIVFKIISSDFGVEWCAADVREPAHVRRRPKQV